MTVESRSLLLHLVSREKQLEKLLMCEGRALKSCNLNLTKSESKFSTSLPTQSFTVNMLHVSVNL